MTIEELRARIAALKVNATGWQSSANGHMEEDGIRGDVLEAIAGGAENAKELAAEALKTSEIKFPRWYE